MRSLKISINIIILLVVLVNIRIGISSSGTISNDINKAVEIGDYTTISNFIDGNVQMSVDAENYVYSQQQAKQILKRFFKQHQPTGYNVLEEGGTVKSKFSIGKLKTENGEYKLYFFFMLSEQKSAIIQLRIESIS